MIGSFFTSNPDAVKAAQSGAVEYEGLPQGTLAKAIRAGDAGIGGFYTLTSAGTVIAKDKEIKIIDGKEYGFKKALHMLYSRPDLTFLLLLFICLPLNG